MHPPSKMHLKMRLKMRPYLISAIKPERLFALLIPFCELFAQLVSHRSCQTSFARIRLVPPTLKCTLSNGRSRPLWPTAPNKFAKWLKSFHRLTRNLFYCTFHKTLLHSKIWISDSESQSNHFDALLSVERIWKFLNVFELPIGLINGEHSRKRDIADRSLFNLVSIWFSVESPFVVTVLAFKTRSVDSADLLFSQTLR